MDITFIDAGLRRAWEYAADNGDDLSTQAIDMALLVMQEADDRPDGQFDYLQTNDQRAERARLALRGGGYDEDGEIYDYTVGDLLADLMHLADDMEISFDGLLDGARRHHRAEYNQEQPCPVCGDTADEDGYCRNPGCSQVGKAVIG